ncbi:MAG: ABC transporter permease [Thaumarchaeota archaeon]|nr:ABC transporter permease [Nitrososphaerota archaeon]
MGFTSFLIKRSIYSLVLVIGVIILTFLLTHIIAPNPANVWSGPHASKSEIQNVITEYHLDQPVLTQLYYYLVAVFTLNLGISPYFKQPVSVLVETYYPRTLELTFVAMGLTIIIGIFTGAFAAAHQEKAGDHSVRAAYLLSWSMPPFLVALLLQFVLAYNAHIFPPSQLADPALTLPTPITGLISLDALIDGNYTFFFSSLLHLILPAVSLALISFGLITRIMRSAMLDNLRTDYVRTAIMKGVGTRRATYVHALKNSLIPVITVISLTFAFLIAGSVVIEEIFSYEGMGYLITQSLYNYDYPTLIGSVLVITISVIIINFIADLLYAAIDPRVRIGSNY